MKVFVCISGEHHEGYGVYKIYDSKEKAVQWLKSEHERIQKEYDWEAPTPIESNSFDWGCDYWQILEYEVE